MATPEPTKSPGPSAPLRGSRCALGFMASSAALWGDPLRTFRVQPKGTHVMRFLFGGGIPPKNRQTPLLTSF